MSLLSFTHPGKCTYEQVFALLSVDGDNAIVEDKCSRFGEIVIYILTSTWLLIFFLCGDYDLYSSLMLYHFRCGHCKNLAPVSASLSHLMLASVEISPSSLLYLLFTCRLMKKLPQHSIRRRMW